MSCSELDELLSAYADGQTVPAQNEFLEAHLTACWRCQAVLQRYRRTSLLLRRSLDDRWAPPDISMRVARTYARLQHRNYRRLKLAVLAFLALLVTGIAGSQTLFQSASQPYDPPQPKSAAASTLGRPVDQAAQTLSPAQCVHMSVTARARCLGVPRHLVRTILADEADALRSSIDSIQRPASGPQSSTSTRAHTILKGGVTARRGVVHRGLQAA